MLWLSTDKEHVGNKILTNIAANKYQIKIIANEKIVLGRTRENLWRVTSKQNIKVNSSHRSISYQFAYNIKCIVTKKK